jgi:uncharacterized SAM-binding protein YcdF (DUF218 family)
MFYFLSKVLAFLISPYFWGFGLLIAAFFWKAKRKKLLLVSILVFYIFSNRALHNFVLSSWEVQTVRTENLRHHDIGIVLGGFAYYDEQFDRIEFNNSADRILMPLKLYNQGKLDKILLSGGSGELIGRGHPYSDLIKQFLIDSGIPEDDIISESESRNTRENAEMTKKVLEQLDLTDKKLLLITSAAHMKRSKACFNQTGLVVNEFSVDRESSDPRYDFAFWVVPNVEILSKWNKLNHEVIGYLAYWAAGYV